MGFKIQKVKKQDPDEEVETEEVEIEEDEAPKKKKKKKAKDKGKTPFGEGTVSDKEEAKPKPGSFLKTGVDAQKEMARDEAERKARKASAGKSWRFYLKDGEDASITFLDGEIDEETGILDIPYLNEHRVKIDGYWRDVACIEEHEPCPLCAAGETKSFVGLLTILDHRPREWEDKDGKTHKEAVSKRLFAAKSETLKQLTKLASKREDGLVGSTYDVSRTGEFKANVGDLFDYNSTHTLKEIAKKLGKEMATPFDYNEQIIVYTAKDMRDLGIGKSVATFGKKSGKKKGKSADDIDDSKSPWEGD